MRHSYVPADTDQDSYAALVESWRKLGIEGRAELTQRLCIDVERLARADIVTRHPTFTEIQICHELARRRYGNDLADAAYALLLADR